MADAAVTLAPDTSHYVLRVLRLRTGDRVVLFNGDGFDYAGQLGATERDRVVVEIDARLPAAPESPLQTTLVQAISRGERMDQTLQKATELGVSAIQPLFTERVEVRLSGQRLGRRMDHWRAVVRSACEQCGRARVPAVAQPLGLGEWAAMACEGQRLALDPDADRHLSGWMPGDHDVHILVGPEGGLSRAERDLLARCSVIAVRLGPRVLRTETAGAAALAVLQAVAGDF